MKRTKASAFLLIPLAVVACKSESGTALQIVDAPAFDDDCSLPAAPTAFQSEGFFDPTGGVSFDLALLLRNNADQDETPASFPGNPNFRPSANDALVLGFDYCFYRADTGDVTAYDPKGEGLVVECDDVSDNQRGFVTSSANVEAGGGQRSTAVSVLDLTQLQALFGETFDPLAISVANDDPRNAVTRSPGWGDFPEARTSRVNVNLRARAKRQDGGTIRSNWFSFPVEICPRCVTSQCQANAVTCPDGSPGIQGEQIAPGSCSSIFSGAPLTCEPVDTCI